MEKILRTLFILSFFVGCSYLKLGESKKEQAPASSQLSRVYEKKSGKPIVSSWFNIPTTFSIFDYVDRVPTHPFLDVAPRLRTEERLINYVLISPAESAYQYDLDLLSGKLYKVRDNCATKDLWGAHQGTIERPNFSFGIVPQIYNQERQVQKILIFKEFFEEDKFLFVPEEFREARIVGSVILEYCESYPCNSRKRWTPTQILIGVDSLDAKYANVRSLSELKDLVTWSYTKAFLENQYGVHRLGNSFYPAYRVIAEYDVQETLNYFKKKSFVVNVNKLADWRKTCFQLYDSLWKEVQRIRGEKSSQQEKFYDIFKAFYLHDGDQFASCQKLVRPANINENPERHWFFSFISAFINLEKNGFYYSCKEEGWFYNVKVDFHNMATSELKELRLCKPSEFEKMFDHSINGLKTMHKHVNKSFRYIEYDSQHGGSHQKIYSWIQEHNKKLACDTTNYSPEIFPQDIAWQPFKPDEILADDKTFR